MSVRLADATVVVAVVVVVASVALAQDQDTIHSSMFARPIA